MPLNDRSVPREAQLRSLQTQTLGKRMRLLEFGELYCTCQAGHQANWSERTAPAGALAIGTYKRTIDHHFLANLLVRNQVIARFTSFQRSRSIVGLVIGSGRL